MVLKFPTVLSVWSNISLLSWCHLFWSSLSPWSTVGLSYAVDFTPELPSLPSLEFPSLLSGDGAQIPGPKFSSFLGSPCFGGVHPLRKVLWESVWGHCSTVILNAWEVCQVEGKTGLDDFIGEILRVRIHNSMLLSKSVSPELIFRFLPGGIKCSILGTNQKRRPKWRVLGGQRVVTPSPSLLFLGQCPTPSTVWLRVPKVKTSLVQPLQWLSLGFSSRVG